ncbi:hypothetical protein PLIIFM63780_008763 [Purpureocillium lilacinum]|nr:hypothetical protein PLIIFM63780_008763 [Purpureocillium lilacinum]
MEHYLPGHVRDYKLDTQFRPDGGIVHFVQDPQAPPPSSKYSRHFVKALGWFASRRHLYIAMEHLPEGDLETYLAGNLLLEDDARQIAVQVLQGLAAMHGEGYAHRDIKPKEPADRASVSEVCHKNVLIQQRPGPMGASSWWVKLADFDTSKQLGLSAVTRSTAHFSWNYVAPEVLFDQAGPSSIDHPATDMWALGVMTFYMLTKSHLFPWQQNLSQYRRSPDEIFGNKLDEYRVGREGQEFIRALVRLEPAERLNAKEASRHEWVRDGIPLEPLISDARSE